ncbi:MAG: nucleotidyltransferase domain-containing protein [Lachnospiraceae bacterium]|nr:nucleotidyltransferase domain-containing protein [Lachnospiraceae bacterium]
MSIQDILKEIEYRCRQHNVEHLYLYGSYAKGTERDTSDIDIIVKGCSNIGALKEDLDRIPTLKKIDVFNYATCKNEYLKEDMDKYGKQIY